MVKGTGLTEGQREALAAMVRVAEYGARVAPHFGGWGPGGGLPCPARYRTTARLMKLVDAGLAEHDLREGYSFNARHHYYRPTPAGRAALAERGGAE